MGRGWSPCSGKINVDALAYFLKEYRWPKDDDLARVNCPNAGAPGHSHCGWCEIHDRPRFECVCHAHPMIEAYYVKAHAAC